MIFLGNCIGVFIKWFVFIYGFEGSDFFLFVLIKDVIVDLF